MTVACPECSAPLKVADDLPASARLKCRRCGTRFTPAPPPSDDAPIDLDECEESTGRRSRVILLAACGGLVLLLASVAVGWFATRPPKANDPPVAAAPPAEPKPPATKNPDPPVTPKAPPRVSSVPLTAAELLDRYRPGVSGYDGVIFTVTGTLFCPASQYPNGEVVVRLAGPHPDGPSVWCRMAPGPGVTEARFQPGATMTVRGRCVGAGVARGPAGYAPADPNEVVLADCTVASEPLLPTPAGVDHPAGITDDGIEVRVTAAQVGHPALVLGGGGPDAGATARSREKYLVFRLQVRNTRKVGFMTVHTYAHPDGSQVRLVDERGNRFDWCRPDAAPEPGSVIARALEADPNRRWRFRDESSRLILDPGETGTYLLVFSADHLGKGQRLFLSLPNRVFGELKYGQVIRFEQAAVEPLPADPVVPPSDPKPPVAVAPGEDKPMPAADPATDAKVVALVTQLAKGKTTAERVKAADELSKLGAKAKAASGPLCQAFFEPSPQVRLAALDALKNVNPGLHGPVVALFTPLTEFDFVGFGPRDRLPHGAVAALNKLGAEGKAAVPVLIYYKRAISRPGGWPYVPAVVDTLAALGADDPAVVAVLVQGLLKDADPAARQSAAKGLADTKATKESVAALTTAVRTDPEAEVRFAAVTALGTMGPDAKAAAKVLEAAKMDPNPLVREAARDALDKIK